jgi:protein-S-isoprenylcysteine O-methyltransferase Ste14
MFMLSWFWIRWGILGLCWGLFCAVWLLGALSNSLRAPTVQKQAGPPFPWMVEIAAFIIGEWLIPQPFWDRLTFDTLWLRVIGIIGLVLATAFTLWARFVLGQMWSSAPVARTGHQLCTDGPYRLSRHPIYTGVLGMLFGTMLLSGLGFYAYLFLLGIVIFAIKIHQEERLLRDTFGEVYVQYQQRVPPLLPGLTWRKGEKEIHDGKRSKYPTSSARGARDRNH